MTNLSLPTFDLRTAEIHQAIQPKTTKVAGVIGGLAPQSTSLFYQTITNICLQNYPNAYPRLLINSVNAWEVVNILSDKDMIKLYQYLIQEINLIGDKADFLVMVCNSVHTVLGQLRQHIPIPVMAIHEEVCKDIALSNIRRVGVLGTQTTIDSGLYQSELSSYGIQFCIQTKEQVSVFDQYIFAEMLYGRHLGTMRQLILEGVQELTDMGCEAVILGCTELPLFVNQDDTSIPLFPSTQILAKSVVDACFGSW